jgi:hypothetical protein
MPGKKSLTRHLGVRLSIQDYNRLRLRFASSASPGFSVFVRDILLSKPIIVRYHNDSADEFLVIALEIKQELADAVLHLESSKEASDDQIEILLSKIEEFKLILHQIYQQCSLR